MPSFLIWFFYNPPLMFAAVSSFTSLRIWNTSLSGPLVLAACPSCCCSFFGGERDLTYMDVRISAEMSSSWLQPGSWQSQNLGSHDMWKQHSSPSHTWAVCCHATALDGRLSFEPRPPDPPFLCHVCGLAVDLGPGRNGGQPALTGGLPPISVVQGGCSISCLQRFPFLVFRYDCVLLNTFLNIFHTFLGKREVIACAQSNIWYLISN